MPAMRCWAVAWGSEPLCICFVPLKRHVAAYIVLSQGTNISAVDFGAVVAACGWRRVQSCQGVVLLQESLEKLYSMPVCFDSDSSFVEHPVANWIYGLRLKQEAGERTPGRLVFKARIQIVPLCLRGKQENWVFGLCTCVWGAVCSSTELHTHTQRQTMLKHTTRVLKTTKNTIK